MNTQNNNSSVAISKAEAKKMTTSVSEPLSYCSKQGNSFTAVDLWNIQRKGRSSQQRKYLA